MANYLEMNREELTAEKAKLNEQYKKFLAMNLKLNMARGKPGPHQMDLAMGLLQMNDYTTDAGTDARNYGDLEACTRLASCLRMCSVLSPRKCSWAATPACS